MKQLIALVLVLVFALTGIIGGSIAANRDRADHPGCVVFNSNSFFGDPPYLDLITGETALSQTLVKSFFYDPNDKYAVYLRLRHIGEYEYTYRTYTNDVAKTFVGEYSFSSPFILNMIGVWSKDSSRLVLHGIDQTATIQKTFIINFAEHRMTPLPFWSSAVVGWMGNSQTLVTEEYSASSSVRLHFYSASDGVSQHNDFMLMNVGVHVISSKGTYLAYAESNGSRTFILIFDVTGRVVRKFEMAANSSAYVMFWSPDEQSLISVRSEIGSSLLQTVDIFGMDGSSKVGVFQSQFAIGTSLDFWADDGKGIFFNYDTTNGRPVIYLDVRTGEVFEKPLEKLPKPIVTTPRYSIYIGTSDSSPVYFALETTNEHSLLYTFEGEFSPLFFTMNKSQWLLTVYGEKTHSNISWAKFDGSARQSVIMDHPTNLELNDNGNAVQLLLQSIGDDNNTRTYILNLMTATLTERPFNELNYGAKSWPGEENITLYNPKGLLDDPNTTVTKFSPEYQIESQFHFPVSVSQIAITVAAPDKQSMLMITNPNSNQVSSVYIAAHNAEGKLLFELKHPQFAHWALDGQSFVVLNEAGLHQYALNGRLILTRDIIKPDFVKALSFEVRPCAPESLN